MKFKYNGENGLKDLDLVHNKILNPQDILTKGLIIDIPDNDKLLIQRLKINGNWIEYNQPVKKENKGE